KLITHIGGHPPLAAAAVPGVSTYALAATDLADLAAGAGSAAVMTQLADAQRSLLRAALGSVYQTASTAAADPSDLRAAWSLLTTLDREHPDALATVLRHPFVRAWAMRSLEQLRPAAWPDRNAARPAPGLGQLGAIAATA